MIELQGDFWEIVEAAEGKCLLCVTTNGVVKPSGELVMGKGIALQFKQRFPTLPITLGRFIKTQLSGNYPHLVLGQLHDIVSFPTKDHWRDSSSLKLIERSARAILEIADWSHCKGGPKYPRIFSVRPGCGAGGLEWEKVREVLYRVGWDDRFCIVEVTKEETTHG